MTTTMPNTTDEITEHLLRLGDEQSALEVLLTSRTRPWAEAFSHHPNCSDPLPANSPLDAALAGTNYVPSWRTNVPAKQGSAWEELECLRGSLHRTPTADPITELEELREQWRNAAIEELLTDRH